MPRNAPPVKGSAFGIFDYSMFGKINRILKPFGIQLKKRTSSNWGDQVEVTVVQTTSHLEHANNVIGNSHEVLDEIVCKVAPDQLANQAGMSLVCRLKWLRDNT